MKLANRIALITGGGRGIGRSIAFAFAREGARVVLLARTKAQVAQTAVEIGEECKADIASWIACDVSNSAHVEPAFNQVSEIFGRRPDILVNNAGLAESAPFSKTTDELWERHLAVNLSGTFHFMRAALPAMIERGWGRIINIASIAGKTGAPYIAAYAASKHGVLGLTRSAALEVASKGVTINAICPGYVDTEMTTRALRNIEAKTGKPASDALEAIKRMSPQNRLITPEEVASLALLLASEEGRGINGQAINVDGGSVLH
ncbi:MAG: 3-hydroxybutyrate dehydrogenase [Acidobacteriota bacterium]|jgi:NAD(P)-dependent dehydrogenase (short-subunit alcohol dehydrogenase family)|nr:3-hydroxybutyrate dehydrogenase [Acidobacteriota bacterium]